jgi:hypothetical protein
MRLTLLIALILVGPFARAEDKTAARAANAEGSRHYDQNEFTPAHEAFKRS